MLDICINHKAQKELKKNYQTLVKTGFCKENTYYLNYGCNNNSCDCISSKKDKKDKTKKKIFWAKQRSTGKRYFRRRTQQQHQQISPQSNKCFICGKPGHWSKNCPLKAKSNPKGAKLNGK